MATAVIMPKLGLTMTEGTIVRWLKAEGDPVEKGEPLLEILTDKANMEVEAQEAGRLHIIEPEGAVVPILEVIGELLAPGEAPGSAASAGDHAAATGPADQAPEAPEASAPGPPSAGMRGDGGRLRISPAARRVARELGVDLAVLMQSDGTGPGGRLVQEDVRRVAARLKREAPVAAQPAQPLTAVEPGPGGQAGSQAGEVQVIPLTGIRGIIAERMSRSA
ncbi:MAG TPA: 2-oxo acid dehydrogenase subunit E2, partial [Firmicutes bacterium]|nr:2-oxo acid dehydrogenase subunit E2 [Bacillota bacterium]